MRTHRRWISFGDIKCLPALPEKVQVDAEYGFPVYRLPLASTIKVMYEVHIRHPDFSILDVGKEAEAGWIRLCNFRLSYNLRVFMVPATTRFLGTIVHDVMR